MKLVAFVERGFLTLKSYSVQFFLQIFSVCLTVASFYYLTKVVSFGENNPYLTKYGGNYFSFLIVGAIFQTLIMTSQNSFSSFIQEEQNMGTLEFLLSTRTHFYQILIFSSAWSYLFSFINIFIVISIAKFGFGLSFAAKGIFALYMLIVLVVGLFSLSGIGMISAGIIMVTKRGDPVGWFVSVISGFLSGVYFPIEILPVPIKNLALLLPHTHMLLAVRLTLANNYSMIGLINNEIIILFIFSLILLPSGFVVFRFCYNKARRDGTLGWY